MSAASPNPNFDFAFPQSRPPHSSIGNYKQRRTLSSLSPSRNSSLQKVWAEDYFDTENYEDEKAFEAASITPPPAATLTTRPFPRSIPLSADEEACPARQTRTHQRSLTALLPFSTPRTRTNSTLPQRPPAKKKSRDEDDFMPTLTGDQDRTIRVADRSRGGGISSWFTGSSAPVAVGIPVREPELSSPTTMSSREGSPERPGAKLNRRPVLSNLSSSTSLSNITPTKSQSSSSSTSRFAFFTSSKNTQPTFQLPAYTLENDEFLTLDVASALASSPGTQDPFSPSSFKNLLHEAEGLLLRLQTAYKIRTLSLHEISSDNSAMADELEEAETRAECFKSQLEDLASKVSEQDTVIADLVAQLTEERQARAEEKEAREKSIALISSNRQEMEQKRASCCDHEHEDLGVGEAGQDRKWRHSGGTDLSLESDVESTGESVFSRSRSPTLTMGSAAASTLTLDTTPEVLQASFGRVVPMPQQTHTPKQAQLARPKLTERPSTFQKILNNISTKGELDEVRKKDVVDDMFERIGTSESGCENCRGRDASVAWDAVGLLRTENKSLKERLGGLEVAVDGALDLIAGLRI